MTECRAIMDARAGSERRWLFGLVAFALIFWLFDLAVLRAGVPDPLDDSWEYGVAARHLIAGDGFRTDVVHPPLLGLRDARFTVPVLVHGPLMPVLVAPLVMARGPTAIDSLAWLAAAAALVAAWLTARLGARAFGAPVGFAAGALYTVAPITIRAVHHDVSLAVGAALLMASLDLLLRERPRAPAAGLAIGLAGLARPELSIAALILAPLAGRRGAWRFLAAALVCLVPWWIHNARATSQPFFNLSSYLLIGYTPARPGLSVLRDLALPPAEFPRALREALPSLPAKWLDAFPHALKRAWMIPTGATGWLAPVGAALALIAARTRGVAVVLAALALMPVAIMTLTVYDSRYLAPFLPLAALGAARGASGLLNLLPSWGRRPRMLIGVLLLAVLPSVAPAMKEATREARGFERRIVTERAMLASWSSGSRRPIYSDTPDFAAFTTRRPAVWMTEREYRSARAAADSPRGAGSGPALPAGDEWFHRGGHE